MDHNILGDRRKGNLDDVMAKGDADLKRRELEERAAERRRTLEEKRRQDIVKKASSDAGYLKAAKDADIKTPEEAFKALIGHPEWPVFYKQLNSIDDPDYQWAYIARAMYEKLACGHVAQGHDVAFKVMLKEAGVKRIICPYYVLAEKSLLGGYCVVADSTPAAKTDAICGGKYPACTLFRERATAASLGEYELPEQKKASRPAPPDVNAAPVDLQDLDDWWKKEGKYE